MSDYFPPNVLAKILLELPVKSLVRFTLVSKTWQAFITSPDFIATHLSRVQYDPTYKNRSGDLLVRYYSELDGKEHYELRPDDSCFLNKFLEIKFRLKSRAGFNQIIGTCNGIICLCDNLCGKFYTCPIVLWNPSIQKDIVLPLPEIEFSTKCFVLGFGYDIQGDDYKVVRIIYQNGFLRKPIAAEIFSLKTKHWKTAENLALKGYINDIGQSQVYLNGIVHWMAYQEKDDGYLQNSILGFDCSDEEFIETVLPDDLASLGDHPNLHITALENCLGMISYNGSSCRIWKMEEYGSAESWIQLYFFGWTQIYEVHLNMGLAKVVGFRNNGELLMTSMVKDDIDGSPFRPALGGLTSYNPFTWEVSEHPQLRGWIDSFHVLEYVETLSLLDYSSIYPKKEVENACLEEETGYPIKKDLGFYDAVMGKFDEGFLEGEDSEDQLVHGFGEFKQMKDESNGDDGCMGEDNVHSSTNTDDDIVVVEEFDDSGKFKDKKDVKNGGDLYKEEIKVENEDDIIYHMEEFDDGWLVVSDQEDLEFSHAKKND